MSNRVAFTLPTVTLPIYHFADTTLPTYHFADRYTLPTYHFADRYTLPTYHFADGYNLPTPLCRQVHSVDKICSYLSLPNLVVSRGTPRGGV